MPESYVAQVSAEGGNTFAQPFSEMEKKPTTASYCETTNLVLPNDANTMGNLFGGQLLKWLDMTCAISAYRHTKHVCVTAAVNNVSFDVPIKLGDLVIIKSHVSRAFNSSMEVWADVWTEDQGSGRRIKCNSAIYTFVAVGANGRPIAVPEVEPVTEEEQQRFDGALRRRQLRLILAGKMKPGEATELRSIFP